MTLTTSYDGARAVVGVVGNLDVATIEELEGVVVAALEEGRDIVLDVREVHLCDSTGLGTLVRLHRRATAAGRALALQRPRNSMAEVLARTGIDKVVPVINDGSTG